MKLGDISLFLVIAVSLVALMSALSRGEPAPIGDNYSVVEYGEWKKIRGEGVRVRALDPVKVDDDEIYVTVEIENVRGVEARMMRFDVSTYTSLDTVNGGVEEYVPICDGRYSCQRYENLDPGKTIKRAVGFKSGDDRGRLELGFYGRGWTRTVEVKKG